MLKEYYNPICYKHEIGETLLVRQNIKEPTEQIETNLCPQVN